MNNLGKVVVKLLFAAIPALIGGAIVAVMFDDLGMGMIVVGAGTVFGYQVMGENNNGRDE